MDTFSLQCFLMLAEQLNFTRAAYTMNISQPTLSRVIATLERTVGTALFNRDKRSISVTEAGLEFAHYAESIIRSCDYACRRAQAVADGGRGMLRVGFLPIMCYEIVPAVMRRMKEEHPNIEVVLEPYSQDKLIFEVNEGNLDLVLILDWKSDRLINCVVEPFFQDYYCVALHRNHRLANQESIGIEEISDEHCLFYKPLGDFRARSAYNQAALSSLFEMSTNTSIKTMKTASDLIGLMTLTDCGQGIAILPSHIQQFALKNTKFIRIRQDEGMEDFTFRGVMCRRQDIQNPALKDIARILHEVGGYSG